MYRLLVGLCGFTTFVALASAQEAGPMNREVTVRQKLRELETASAHDFNPASLLPKEKRANVIKNAHAFAQKTAGSDDKKYVRALEGSFNAGLCAELDLTEDDLFALSAQRSALTFGSFKTVMLTANEALHPPIYRRAAQSITDHPRYAVNFRKLIGMIDLIDDLNPAGPTLRIVGGVSEGENIFQDCVCVGGAGGYCCTGTLIGKNVVITAGHCYPCIRFGTKVFVGQDITKPGKEYTGTAIRHPEYGKGGKHNDVCVIVLNEDVQNVTSRTVATSGEIDAAFFTRAVGYGTTDLNGTVGFGIRRYADLPVVLASCHEQPGANHFGCDSDLELVAGIVGLNRDTCKGDSGGPLYVFVNNVWKYAAVTSRATDQAPHVCGDGGIYARIDRYIDWVRMVPGARW